METAKHSISTVQLLCFITDFMCVVKFYAPASVSPSANSTLLRADLVFDVICCCCCSVAVTSRFHVAFLLAMFGRTRDDVTETGRTEKIKISIHLLFSLI